MSDYSDQALLVNILRAKDNAPLDFNDLSAITGSFSISGTAAFTLPYGPLTGTPTQSNSYKRTFSPSITGTSSPVITLGTLNTQGFMITMIQPISTTYVLSKWNSHSHELLLYLFAKAIRFPNEKVHRNNPDDKDAFADFQQLVRQLVSDGNVEMKSLLILDPIGNPIPIGQTLQITAPPKPADSQTPPAKAKGSAPSQIATQYQLTSDYTAFQLISGLGDGQLHVGNVECPKEFAKNGKFDAANVCPADSHSPFVQFYKEYPAQIALCVDLGIDGTLDGHYVASISDTARNAQSTVQGYFNGTSSILNDENAIYEFSNAESILHDELNAAGTSALRALKGGGGKPQGSSGSSQGAGPAGGGQTGGGGGGGVGAGGGGGGGGSGGGAMPQVTMSLQPNRISGILNAMQCATDEIVLPKGTEHDYQTESRRYAHIEWRSVTEVIQYLGAIARLQDRTGTGFALNLERERPAYLFTYAIGDGGRIAVHYRNSDFSVPHYDPSGSVDHSLEALAMLNELISLAKISGSLPVPQPVQVLP
jgi:hypothetical protein